MPALGHQSTCGTLTCQTLKVRVISIPVHVFPVGEHGFLVAVWHPSERGVIVETRVEDLVDDFLRLLSADFSHGKDGAYGTTPDTLLFEENENECG